MKFKKTLKIFLAVFLLSVLVYVFFGIKGKSQPAVITEMSADGKDVKFYTYNEKGKKTLELTCSEAYKESSDKTLMKNIQGLIFKEGRMDRDIKIFGNEGYVENNFYNFYIEGNARLVSKDFIITSNHFNLKDRAALFSAPKVYYQTDVLKGSAANGMEYYINNNTLKFLKTRGTYKRDQRSFDYQTNVWWFFEDSKLMAMEKEVVIKEDKSLLRSDWVTLKFNDELTRVVETSTQNNSYLYMEDTEKNEIKEIKAANIVNLYDDKGHLTFLKVMKDAQILLKNKTNRTLIASQDVEMNIDGPTGKTKDVHIPMRGIIENTGKTDFKVTADTIAVQYDQQGEINYCQATGNVEFIIEEYRGLTKKIDYDIEKETIALDGENSQIKNKNNTFTSTKFMVDVKKKILTSNQPVKSLIHVEKENALFSTDPIYINSARFTIFEKEKKFKYDGQVNLSQGDTRLNARTLEINEDGRISAQGSVDFSFKEGDKEVAVKADELTFNPEAKRIDIAGNAIIKSDVNVLRAGRFVLQFNQQNEIDHIGGEEDIYFTKEELSGTSRRVKWLFKKEILVLQGSPQVVNQSGTRTVGKELSINLQNNKITILSEEFERSETIIQ
jgi:lipopolysaccharide transport protein LptA